MSLDQYNSLMSNLLREKCSLTKLRKELERRKGKLCQCCKRFRHLARNCRNKEERKKGTIIPQNKFEVLRISQTSFSHISINSLTIPTVLMATGSPWKDLSIDTSHVLKQSVMAKILGRSTGNHHGTIY